MHGFCLCANPSLALSCLAAKHFLVCTVITGSCPATSKKKNMGWCDIPCLLSSRPASYRSPSWLKQLLLAEGAACGEPGWTVGNKFTNCLLQKRQFAALCNANACKESMDLNGKMKVELLEMGCLFQSWWIFPPTFICEKALCDNNRPFWILTFLLYLCHLLTLGTENEGEEVLGFLACDLVSC